MNKKLLISLAIIIFVGIGVFLIFGKSGDLVSPKIPLLINKSNPSPIPEGTPAPPNAPKSFQYDSSTDLEAELEKVNSQVLDSDFE
jgi:hypothetical protein